MMLLSKFFRMLVLVLLMLPVAARGEVVLSLFGWSEIDTSLHFNGAKWFYHLGGHLETSTDGHLQNPGFGFGATVWLGRDFFFGMFGFGLDVVPSAKVDVGGANMWMELMSLCLLVRLPPKGFAFLHGRLVPYAGFGYSGLYLDGEAAFFAGTKEDYSLEPLTEGALFGKIGLEWIITGPLAVFLEAHYVTCSATDKKVDDSGNETYVEAQLKCTQVCLGIDWHF
jgi:hypothetical protein